MLEGVRILVVDDDVDALGALAEALHRLGAEVTLATAVGEAVDAYTRLRHDAIVSAVTLDVADGGLELAKAVRALDGDDGRAVLVAVQGWRDLRSERRAAAAGFDACAVKPVYSRDLAGLISHFLERERNGARTQ